MWWEGDGVRVLDKRLRLRLRTEVEVDGWWDGGWWWVAGGTGRRDAGRGDVDNKEMIQSSLSDMAKCARRGWAVDHDMPVPGSGAIGCECGSRMGRTSGCAWVLWSK